MKWDSSDYRIKLGSIGYFWSIIFASLDAFSLIELNPTVFATVVGFSSALLVAGIAKMIGSKKEEQKSFK